jgi:hypothetical protein
LGVRRLFRDVLHEGHLVAVRIGHVDDLDKVGDDHRFTGSGHGVSSQICQS